MASINKKRDKQNATDVKVFRNVNLSQTLVTPMTYMICLPSSLPCLSTFVDAVLLVTRHDAAVIKLSLT